jgi:hypothetical protein
MEDNVIKTKYADKMVDSRYYKTVEITGDGCTPPILTEEEFKAGKAGIVFLNAEGKIVFDKPISNENT